MMAIFRLMQYRGSLASVNGGIEFHTIGDIVGKILQPVGALATIVAVALVIYGGFLYITSQGESQKISKAMKVITSALIGLGIVLFAFVITNFVKEIITK